MAAYTWNNGFTPPYGYADPFGYGYASQFHVDATCPPPPPPGYGWVDIGAVASPLPLYASWTNMQPWNQYFAQNQNGGAGNVNDASIPGAVYKNAHGTVGLEPGYNYLFPKEHCKIHVLISATPPWQLNAIYQKRCFDVPCGITVKELMQQFGCTNPDPAKNRLYELSQGPQGHWYKGFEVNGSEKDKMSKKIEEVGWNSRRNGIEHDFVWLYFAKE